MGVVVIVPAKTTFVLDCFMKSETHTTHSHHTLGVVFG